MVSTTTERFKLAAETVTPIFELRVRVDKLGLDDAMSAHLQFRLEGLG